MVLKESICLDRDENGLRIDPADVDGIHIVEMENEQNRVYVYYSELPKLGRLLNEIFVKHYKK